MLKNFNLLVTTRRGEEEDACSEIWYLLGEIGDLTNTVNKTGISGLIAVKTIFDPLIAVSKIREMFKKHPEEFRFILRVIPIEKVVNTDLKEIKRITSEIAYKIRNDESFRISVKKRYTQISSKKIIKNVAAQILRRVDLKNQDKIILIEIVGKFTGISIIKPEDIFSICN